MRAVDHSGTVAPASCFTTGAGVGQQARNALRQVATANNSMRAPQMQMGPTLLSAPSTPASQPDDFGRSPVPGLLPLSLLPPCGSCTDCLGLAGGSVRNRLSSPGHLAGVRSRQAVVPVSPANRLDLHPTPGGSVTALMPYRSGVPVHEAEALLSFRPSRPLSKRPTDCAPLTASAVRQIRSEDLLRRVFRRC